MNSAWHTISIKDLGRVVTGRTPSSSNPEHFGSSYPFITPSDISLDNRHIETERYVSEVGKESLERILLPKGAVCFVCIGATIGKICVTSRPSFTNQQINSVVVDESKHDSRFAFYALSLQGGNAKALAGGAATPIINKSAFSDIEIEVPDLPAQRKIAGILSAYDDLIENNLRRIKILEEMAQSLYREWFVHFRFPGHESAKFVDSPLGEIPKGWKVKKLAEIAGVNAESIRATTAPEKIEYIDIASVSTGSIDNIEAMSFESAPSRARRVVRHGDIIWSTVRPNRRSFSLIIDPAENLIASTGFAVLSARTVPWSYFYQTTTTEDFTSYLVNHASGAAYPAVNSGIFENADVVVPPGDLLKRFNAMAESNQVLQHKLRRRNQTLRRTRDLLLPKLIGGRIPITK
jgi:type I restriction enzyme S subunit